jgi:sialidase-1
MLIMNGKVQIILRCILHPSFILSLFSGCTSIQPYTNVTTTQLQVPVLKGKNENYVLYIKVAPTNIQPIPAVKSIKINLEGTDELSDIAEVKIFYAGKDSVLNDSEQHQLFGNPAAPAKQITFNGELKIPVSPSFFIISFQLSKNASLHHKIDVACVEIQYEDNTYSVPVDVTPGIKQHIGIALRQHLDDGVDTYRIPGLTTTNQGTLLAIYDARRNSSRDLQGDIDIGVSRSTDGGKTWEPMRIGLDMEKWGNLPEKFNGVSDACILVDRNSDKIFLAGLWMHGVLDKNGNTFSNITYSKDRGKTWHTSQPACSNTTENMVAQLSDGSIMLNARYNPNRSNQTETNGRVVVTTNDLGQTWTEHPTSHSALIESTCMASLHKHVYHKNGIEKSVLLFSNPNTKTGRHHMTLKVSLDDGNTWPEKYWMLLDEGKSRGYSCITSIDENTIGILYEGSQSDLVFQKIKLNEILKQ